ncbi:GTPase [Cohnella rhizosphaerae]|uniref:GTPase domain-containing protein n=1 Tax=Cohnella rhizosphaerae TaxID=1457232 RepID=A0A9X4KTP7_9BACL|nr:GTPase domain-containing protein [Cohnella rhizosphaerae]MDG0810810.1 GTPase domain-containing protein [Cohnella rhizosphaerae]
MSAKTRRAVGDTGTGAPANAKARSARSGTGAGAEPTVLERNLRRLAAELAVIPRTRKIAILGQPGAGKSALLDLLTDRGCVPRPVVGQRTDATSWAHDPNAALIHRCGEAVFVDSPGHGTAAHPAEAFFRLFPYRSFDRLLLVFKDKLHAADDRLLAGIAKAGLAERTMLVRSFADGLLPEEREPLRRELAGKFAGAFAWYSARDRSGLAEIERFAFGPPGF